MFLIFRQIIKSGHKTFETNTGIIGHLFKYTWTHLDVVRRAEPRVLPLGPHLDHLPLAGGEATADQHQEDGGPYREADINQAPLTVGLARPQIPLQPVLHPGRLTRALPRGLVTRAVSAARVLTHPRVQRNH